jgi:hypothetical protein
MLSISFSWSIQNKVDFILWFDMISNSRRCTWLSNDLHTDSITRKKKTSDSVFSPLFCRHCNTIISARIFSVQINLWLTFSSHDWWCLVDVNKRKYPCIVALSLSVVYHSRCNLKTRSMMLMLLWSTFFFLLRVCCSILSAFRAKCVYCPKKKRGRWMTWPVDWRDGKRNGHFTFSRSHERTR